MASLVALGGIAADMIFQPVGSPLPGPRHDGSPVRDIARIALTALGTGSARARTGRAGGQAGGRAGGRADGQAQRWIPEPGTRWQWQLTTPVDLTVNAPIYDIDGFDNSAAVVQQLHSLGRKVICYIDVGAAENFRSDYGSFPAQVLGKSDGWPGERYLDIRRIDLLGPIMAKRFDMCRSKGFDAIEADVVDGYSNDTGFPLTAADQIAYNRYIAKLAHRRGLSVALKNDVEQVDSLVYDFDFSIDEQCFQYDECDQLAPFISHDKAVLEAEYSLSTQSFCPQALALGLSAMRKTTSLDALRWPCLLSPARAN